MKSHEGTFWQQIREVCTFYLWYSLFARVYVPFTTFGEKDQTRRPEDRGHVPWWEVLHIYGNHWSIMSKELPTLQKEYRERVIPALTEKFNYANVNQVPKVDKIVINSCVGKEADRKAAVEDVLAEIAKITGQQPIPTVAKKSVANFRLREGDQIGAKVTLRGRTMYEFLERFVRTAMPRIRDFRGVSPKSFDGRGNYAIGINDQTIFPEIELDKVKRQIGFDIIITTTANTDDEARELLTQMGVPFRKIGKKSDQAA